ncbi:MAG: hypothetical protein JNL70_13645 [Saprospiraceae bacterium]|nr:hypothetical protein [Saprospiraceae bacterium]
MKNFLQAHHLVVSLRCYVQVDIEPRGNSPNQHLSNRDTPSVSKPLQLTTMAFSQSEILPFSTPIQNNLMDKRLKLPYVIF